MKKIRFGVIGCGSIANEYHLPALRRVEGAQLVWACDLIEERAQKAKDDFGFEKYTLDYHDILNDSSCCFSKRMRKVFRKNEKSMLQNCNKKAKRKGRLQRVKKPM